MLAFLKPPCPASSLCKMLLTSIKKRNHITIVLSSLYWLPVKFGIDFKVLLVSFKALYGLVPSHLSSFLHCHSTPQSLKSANQLFLSIPQSDLRIKGDCAFFFCCQWWTILPLQVFLSSGSPP